MVRGFSEDGALGNGEWALGIKQAAVSNARSNTILSILLSRNNSNITTTTKLTRCWKPGVERACERSAGLKAIGCSSLFCSCQGLWQSGLETVVGELNHSDLFGQSDCIAICLYSSSPDFSANSASATG
ncbi:MAG: hypothetical protein ICV85_13490 [Tolypothrix sp. T3-bin4]|nr:hypothetical protein [Tolypothrix sp. T3-bin4]